MIKIHISPNAIYGIKRVYDAMVGYLPQFGIENVGTPHEADIIVNHGASLITDGSKPLIHIGHGLYWSRQPWGDDAYETNARVIESMCASVAHTVPSEWVGRAVRRGGYFYPEVVYHGVDADEFTPNPNHNGTILFNKARADYVSDPNDMLKLAAIVTHRKFVSTVGRKNENVEIIGTFPYEQMKSLVAGSGLYLCTARETFGIGTLEAMACFTDDTNVCVSGIIRRMRKIYSGKLITITVGKSKIRVTPEHPFWTRDGWVLAKHLTKKHQLCYNSKYDTNEKVHTGTIRSIVEDVRDIHDLGDVHFYRDDERCNSQAASQYGSEKDIRIVHSIEANDAELRTTLLHSRDNRRRGNDYDKEKRKEAKAANQYLQYVDGIDGLDKENNELNRRNLHRNSGENLSELENSPLLYVPDNWTRIPSVLRGTSPTHNNQEGATKAPYRVDETSKISKQGGSDFESPLGDYSPYQRVEYQTIEEIEEEWVENIYVYNFTTKTGTYLAEGYIVHNCGVPVVGWDWGGQSEIIKQGETGYLAHPGNYKELAECVELAFEQRDRLSANALADVRERWGWQPRVKQYAGIIKRVYADYYETKRPKVSVIITTHHLDKYLPDCIGSVTSQSMTDYECLVIDDAQSDETEAVWGGVVKDGDKRFRYLRTPRNLGLVGARNFGFAHAKGRYIRHLDADDMLAPGTLAIEATALDKDPTLHIAYGHLEVIREDGSRVIGKSGEPVRSDWPPEAYNWYQQMTHLNQLPSCVMARREVFERSGGYRERMVRNEDAEFWCRVTSLGFRARKVTQAVTYLHRERHDSKGATEWKDEGKEPDWTAWFPWRQGAADFSQAREIIRKHGDTPRKPHLVPFAAQGKPPRKSWYAHDYAYPVVSVIVTVGPNHERFVLDALDSLQAQTYTDWECVLVNDTGHEWNKDVMGAPWARVISTGGNKGASVARNEGFKHARGKYVIWLDADDYWLPWFLERMVSAAENNAGVIYSDFIQMFSEKEFKAFHYMPDFDVRTLFKGCSMPGTSILVPRALADKVKWDTEIPGIEDWEFQIALANECACFYHIPELLFVYRYYSTTKREKDHALRESILEYIKKKWDLNGIIEKRREQMACGCGGKKLPNLKPTSTMSASGNFSQKSLQEIESEPSAQMVMLEYIGSQAGTFSLRSKVSRDITYRFGNNDSHRLHSVLLGDAEIFLGMNERGAPIFKMLQGGGVSQANDPTEFIGHPIAA